MNAFEKYAAKRILVEALKKEASIRLMAQGLRHAGRAIGRGVSRPTVKQAVGGAGAGIAAGTLAKKVIPQAKPVAPPKKKFTSPFGANPPKPGSPTAAKWTARANRNAQRMGHGGRWNFSTGQSMPVTQSTQSGLTTGR